MQLIIPSWSSPLTLSCRSRIDALRNATIQLTRGREGFTTSCRSRIDALRNATRYGLIICEHFNSLQKPNRRAKECNRVVSGEKNDYRISCRSRIDALRNATTLWLIIHLLHRTGLQKPNRRAKECNIFFFKLYKRRKSGCRSRIDALRNATFSVLCFSKGDKNVAEAE